MEEEVQETWRVRWGRFRNHWAGRWVVDLALVAIVFFGVMAFQSRNLVGSGETAPDFKLSALSGAPVQLGALRGKKVLVVFWAPWCGVCGAESDNVAAVHEAYAGDDDVEVLSVVLGYEGLDSVKAFVAEHEVTYPVLLGNRDVQRAYRISSFPTAYIISETGEVEDTVVGYTTQLGLRLRLAL